MCAVDIISGDRGAVKGAAAVRFCERQRCGSNPVQLRFSERDTQSFLLFFSNHVYLMILDTPFGLITFQAEYFAS